MTMKLADDCFFHDKDRMPHDEALAILKSRVRPVVDGESIDMHAAQGRYLAEPVLAPRDIPAHDNAAVDGYAFSHSAYNRQAGARLKIVGEAAAGHPYLIAAILRCRRPHLHGRGHAGRLRHRGNAGGYIPRGAKR